MFACVRKNVVNVKSQGKTLEEAIAAEAEPLRSTRQWGQFVIIPLSSRDWCIRACEANQ